MSVIQSALVGGLPDELSGVVASGGDDEDAGVEEHRQGRAVLGGRFAEYGQYGAV